MCRTPEPLESGKVVRLWVHETWRTFGDRLASEDERRELLTGINSALTEDLSSFVDETYRSTSEEGKSEIEISFSQIRNLRFANRPMTQTDAEYDEVHVREHNVAFQNFAAFQNLEAVNENLMVLLEKNKSTNDLVLFEWAINHLIRILRILSIPSGCHKIRSLFNLTS